MANILLYDRNVSGVKMVPVKLPYGSYTFNELKRMNFNPALIDQIVLANRMKIIVYTGPTFNGDTYIFNAGDTSGHLVDAGDLYNYGLYGRIKSLVVSSQPEVVCGNSDEIKENGIEHFDSNVVVNTCHFICNSLTLMNVFIAILLVLMLFMCFRNYQEEIRQ